VWWYRCFSLGLRLLVLGLSFGHKRLPIGKCICVCVEGRRYMGTRAPGDSQVPAALEAGHCGFAPDLRGRPGGICRSRK